jgi:hypothetical protein
MKKVIVISALAVLATLSSYGQGSVFFGNNSSTLVRMDSATGAAVAPGSRFMVELMYAPDQTPLAAFDAVATAVGSPVSFNGPPGVFNGSNRTVDTITPAGGFGLFQVRVWETATPGATDYRSAVLTGNSAFRAGASGILRVDTGDPTTTPPGTAALLTANGLTGFFVSPIPEPSVIGLGLLGAGALLMLRRRK